MNYQVFFDTCRSKIYFNSPLGKLHIYDLFDLPIEQLKQIYIQAKKDYYKFKEEDDPVLQDVIKPDPIVEIKYNVLKEIILFKKAEAQKAQLKAKEKELKRMLDDIKLKELTSNPEKIKKELEKIREQLGE